MNFFNYIKEHKLSLLIINLVLNILLIITCIFLSINLFNFECEKCDNNTDFRNVNEINKTDEKLYVDIKGAIKNPGVYEVTSKNIINDVISMAGGFNKNAYKNNINLSKKVSNELVIYVYTKSEYKKLNTKEEIVINECVCPTYDII